jgi:two-component sensor histidine kinase
MSSISPRTAQSEAEAQCFCRDHVGEPMRIARWIGERWHSIWRLGLLPCSLQAFLFAIACVGIATLVRIGLGLISPDSAVFAPYYSATLVAALVGGAEAGMLAVGLGGLAAYWLFVPPHWSAASFRVEQLVSLILYGASSVVIIWAAQSYRGLLERLRKEEVTRQLLNLELVHRIKNILAGAQGIIGQALRGQEDLLESVSGRLAALGATNDLLIKSEWQSAPLREILLHEFAPYGASRFQLRGEDVECPRDLAITLALIVHELTTNAVKYGALSSPYGLVTVAWSLLSARFTLEWIESGGPKPILPTREGFGSKLLRSSLRQFDGTVDRRFDPGGLQCEISLTIPQKEPKREVAGIGYRAARSKMTAQSLISQAEE